jgi:transglutaminase-like putative cysteine protease
MRQALAAIAMACAALPYIARPQAPTAADSIYRLAADSTAYPHQPTVLLLDNGMIRVAPDGRVTRTFRQVVQILRQDAVSEYREIEFSYNPDRDTFRTNWIRVLGPDGRAISTTPAHAQESDVAVPTASPVHQRQRIVRYSLVGVAPGTMVDYSTTFDSKAPYRPGDFLESWVVAAGRPVRRSRFILDVPETFHARIVEHHLTFARHESVRGHHTVYDWTAAELPWWKDERFRPPLDSNDLVMSVDVASSAAWSDIGTWYADVARDPARATSTLRDSVRRVVAHATTRDDSIRAVHRWVAQDVRSVSVPLGVGGYQPRAPDTVLSTGVGDSNDKVTLFVAALSILGVQADPALIDADGTTERALPAIKAFNHLIAALPTAQGYQFVDPTAEFTPFGQLPHDDAGKFVLVVHPDGQTDERMTPDEAVDANRTETYTSGSIDTTGIFTGWFDVRGYGLSEQTLRTMLQVRPDSAQTVALIGRLITTFFTSARADSLRAFDGKDLSAWATVSARISNGRAIQRAGASEIMPIGDHSGEWAALADELQSQVPRLQAIDAGAIVGAVGEKAEFSALLPEGWHAQLPRDVVAESVFGSYKATYRQHGRLLDITHRLIPGHGIVGKEHLQELIDWCRTIATDRVPFITIDHS